MPGHKHKHKPGMVMVISIGAKPKKKGETGVKKEARDPETGVTEAYNQAQNFPKGIPSEDKDHAENYNLGYEYGFKDGHAACQRGDSLEGAMSEWGG